MSLDVPTDVSDVTEPRGRRRTVRGVLAVFAPALAAGCMACSPVYVVKAGIAEVRILRARQPIHAVLNDSTVDADTRGKLSWVVEARRFAADDLGIDVGDSYTMYTQLDRDTLAMVELHRALVDLAPRRDP